MSTQIVLPDPSVLLDEIMAHWKSHYEAALDNKHSEEAHTPNLEMWLQFDATRPHDDCFVLEFDGNMSGIGRIVTLNLTNDPYADHAERHVLDQCVTPLLASIREFATAEGLDWVAFEDAAPALAGANAAGFTRHDFGGNTIWFVRREPSRVLAITAVHDSFPPATMGEESEIVAYDAIDFALWEAGTIELSEVGVLGEHRATCAECLAWYSDLAHPCPKCGNPTDPSNFDPINSRWCFHCVEDFPTDTPRYKDIRDIPNNDDATSPSNADRADRIGELLAGFGCEAYAEDGWRSGLIDMLTDIRHYCQREGLEFADLDRAAAMHFEEEAES